MMVKFCVILKEDSTKWGNFFLMNIKKPTHIGKKNKNKKNNKVEI
jgi:hypothetical protein